MAFYYWGGLSTACTTAKPCWASEISVVTLSWYNLVIQNRLILFLIISILFCLCYQLPAHWLWISFKMVLSIQTSWNPKYLQSNSQMTEQYYFLTPLDTICCYRFFTMSPFSILQQANYLKILNITYICTHTHTCYTINNYYLFEKPCKTNLSIMLPSLNLSLSLVHGLVGPYLLSTQGPTK